MDNKTATQKISFIDLLGNLFALLSSREKDVLERRHGLLSGADRKETLEKIGQDYKVTRERVRQIERDGIKRIREKVGQSGIPEYLNQLEETIQKFLKKYGGVMQEDHLLDNLIDFYGLSSQGLTPDDVNRHKKSLSFIISQLLSDKFEKIEGKDGYHDAWKLKEAPWEFVEEVIEKMIKLIDSHGHPLKVDELFKSLKSQDFYQEMQNKKANLPEMEKDLMDLDEAIMSYLRTSKKIKQNLFGHVGLSHWNTITPKRMADKIYLVMQESGKPLHFTDIARLINEANFDHKKALPATIHNELILDDRYVLIGRGIYALKEWGYESGTVADVVETILKSKGPLTKDQITEEVGKQRMVKKATINLALMNKSKFKKLADKKYALVEA